MWENQQTEDAQLRLGPPLSFKVQNQNFKYMDNLCTFSLQLSNLTRPEVSEADPPKIWYKKISKYHNKNVKFVKKEWTIEHYLGDQWLFQMPVEFF